MPIKKKYARTNQASFMNKELLAILVKSQLRNKVGQTVGLKSREKHIIKRGITAIKEVHGTA